MIQYLYVGEIFKSIDGEVNCFYQGRQTIFLRLGGCNFEKEPCQYCDTKKYLPKNSGNKMTIKQVAKLLSNYNCKNLTITGGEPLIQVSSIVALLELKEVSYIRNVSIETNGSIYVQDSWFNSVKFDKYVTFVIDCKLGDPQFEKMDRDNWIDSCKSNLFIKMVIVSDQDAQRAIECYRKIRSVNKHINIAFSPAWDDNLDVYRKSAQKLISLLDKANINDVIINSQLHKILKLK